MKPKFNSIEEFIEVISGITNDGSIIFDMKDGIPDVPKEKQFEYVEVARII